MQIAVANYVKVGDTVVIPPGASVEGKVVLAQPKRRLGRTGKLDLSIERVIAADGTPIPLRYTLHKKEGGSHAVMTGVLTAGAAVVFWPAAPFFLLIKGKDITLHREMEFDVFTDQTFTLKLPAPAVAPIAAAPAADELGAAPLLAKQRQKHHLI